jgi:hypothetical protein
MIRIDREFEELIPHLSEAEFTQLEKNICVEGCRDPLVLWGDTLIDGHHRYRICTEHNIPFNTIEKQFNNRAEVIEWIIENQWGRRNLPPYMKASLALKLEESLKEQGKNNQKAAGEGSTILTKADTRREVARIAGLSEGTISKVKEIERNATPEQRENLKAGKVTINHVYMEIRQKEYHDNQTDEPLGEAEKKAVLNKCIFELEILLKTIERQGIDISVLREFIDKVKAQ